MVQATCISAYFLILGYLLTLFAVLSNGWSKRVIKIPLLLFIGCKLNAIGFYHLMEFTSSTPPPNLVAYFSVEGPYLVSMFLVVLKIWTNSASADSAGKKRTL
jgi:hypothetical protein